MAGYTVAKIDDIEGIYGGAFKRARSALGITSFGMQVMDLPPNNDAYPEHDHASDGQEEVYATLRGGGEIEIDGERHPIDADHLVSVKAGHEAQGLQRARGHPPADHRRHAGRGLRGARTSPRSAQPDPAAGSPDSAEQVLGARAQQRLRRPGRPRR